MQEVPQKVPHLLNQKKQANRFCWLTWSFVVGVTRFELVTSSVSAVATTRSYTLWLLGNGKRLVNA